MVRTSNTKERHISYYGQKYNVQKRINNKSILFARFDNLEDAIKHRDYCISKNWDLDLCKLTKTTKTKKGYKHINKLKNGSYQVIKLINGKNIHYGIFNTFEDAEKHRDYCVANNWNKKCIIRKRKDYNKYNLPKYISYAKKINRYVLTKNFKDGKQISISFKNLNDALIERELLIKCNWDENKLIELDEAYGSLSYQKL